MPRGWRRVEGREAEMRPDVVDAQLGAGELRSSRALGRPAYAPPDPWFVADKRRVATLKRDEEVKTPLSPGSAHQLYEEGP